MRKLEGGKQSTVRTLAGIIEKCAKLADLYITSTENPDIKFNKLIHLIGSVEVLTLAYERIKSKPGNITPGADKRTLDGTSIEIISKLSKDIMAGTYKFSPSRRKYIPKPGKTEKRPLGIASPREKIVQKAIQRVLEIVYEPRFKDTSHGFRPGKGTHSARRYIYRKMKYPKWFIEADITKCFDKINHEKLRNLITKKITCQKTLARVKSALKSGYIEIGGVAQRAREGTPQGSVLSPLLCNIYLHELDAYMESLKKEFDKGSKRKTNPEYIKVQREIKKVKADSEITKEEHEKAIKELQKKIRKIPSKKSMDPEYKKMHYVRYADDFRISVIGSVEDTKHLKEKVKAFLKEERKLTLNEDKTIITKSTSKAFFLGTEISRSDGAEKKVIQNERGKKTRIGGNYRSRKAPTKKLLGKLVKRGFMRGIGSTARAVPRMRRTNREHPDILTYFNAVVRGIRNYYSFAANRSNLSKVVWMAWKSCALTLAKKFKRKTIKKVVDKFGKELEHKETGKKFYKPDNLVRMNHFNVSGEINLEMTRIKWTNKMTKSNLGKTCVICGKTPVEMHHVRKIRDLKNDMRLDWFTKQMALINRKQVPLCKEHHRKVHNNSLNIIEQNLLKENIGKRKK